MARRYWYVVVSGTGWAVKEEGKAAGQQFATQAVALQRARELAHAAHQAGQQTGVRLQNAQGQFRDEMTYGNDPNPPRG